MKKAVLFFTFLVLLSVKLFSQDVATRDMLKSKEWVNQMDAEGNFKVTQVYSNDSIIETVKNMNNSYKNICLYYLTDSADEKFDKEKVGKSDVGKYIVSYSYRTNNVFVFEIVSLTDKILKLVNPQNTRYSASFKAAN